MTDRPTYYVIELTARWLTVLLVALAVVVVLAFGLGYGAGVAARGGGSSGEPTRLTRVEPTQAVGEELVTDSGPDVRVSEATPVPGAPTITPPPGWSPAVPARPTGAGSPPPTATPSPTATPEPTPAPTREPDAPGGVDVEEPFWVQVLASSSPESVRSARSKLEELGFPPEHQRTVSTPVAGGNALYKLRVGPFPDRASADRVVLRMQAAGYPDAWVVAP